MKRILWDRLSTKLDVLMGARKQDFIVHPITFPTIFDDCRPLWWTKEGNWIQVYYKIGKGRKVYSMGFRPNEVLKSVM